MKTQQETLIVGRNAVFEALRNNISLSKIFVQKELQANFFKELKEYTKKNNIPVTVLPGAVMQRLSNVPHQGIAAIKSDVTFHSLADVLSKIKDKENPTLIMLDSITDVRNFGAIARSAWCFGIDAIIISADNAAPVNEEAIKASAGALLHIPIARVSSLVQCITTLQENDYNVVSTTMEAETNLYDLTFAPKTCLVLGAEDTGVKPHLIRASDVIIKIPMTPNFDSLNVSVAAGILLHERHKSLQVAIGN
jgi:23S rRNA (guanosine2251-2'-O)-methyltransferase